MPVGNVIDCTLKRSYSRPVEDPIEWLIYSLEFHGTVNIRSWMNLTVCLLLEINISGSNPVNTPFCGIATVHGSRCGHCGWADGRE